MIDRDEFERRVHYWFALVMSALSENVHQLIQEGKAFKVEDLDNPAFALIMRQAADYQAKYLPDDVLMYFLDPTMPKDYFQTTSRLEFLLQQGLLQKSAQIQTHQCLMRAQRRA